MGQCLVFPSERSNIAQCKLGGGVAIIDGLRSAIGAHEAPRSLQCGVAPLQFGNSQLDDSLPWGGLPTATLHEISGTTAAAGFVAALASRLTSTGPILWCRQNKGEMSRWYGPGLLPFGLNPERVIFVDTQKKKDLLWAMEEGLRSAQPALVIGETDNVSLVASRRLQLAAETGGVTAFLLNVATTHRIAERMVEQAVSRGALSRWAVSTPKRTRKGHQFIDNLSRWRVDLIHCRGGIPRSWLVEWNHEWSEQPSAASEKGPQGRFAVVAELFDRQSRSQPRLRQVS